MYLSHVMSLCCCRTIVAMLLLNIFRTSVAEECSWSWIGDSAEKANHCENKCFLSRQRETSSGRRCSYGALTEDIRNCGVAENACPDSDFVQIFTLHSCSGVCDRALEVVTLQCISNPSCTKIQTRFCTDKQSCSGEWSQWMEDAGGCNVVNGVRQRTRKCLRRENNASTMYCEGGHGQREQVDQRPCMKSCDDIQSQRLPIFRESATTCRCHCANIDRITSHQYLYNSCDAAVTKQSNFQESTCNYIHGFVMSCEGIPDERVCALAESFVFCEHFLDWSDWGSWESKGNSRTESRSRHRWCSSPLFQFSDALPCHLPLQVEKQCKDEDSGFELKIWMVVCIAIVGVLLIVVVVIICLCKRKLQRNKNKDDITKNKKEAGKTPDVNMDKVRRRSKHSESDRLTVFDRLSRISEHLYEAIHGRTSPQSSPGNGGQTSHLFSKDKLNKSPENQKDEMERYQPCKGKKNPLRISVTVTDPEGVQVGKSVYKTKRPGRSPNKERSRWSRMPTPEPQSSSQFFISSLSAKPVENQLRVPSVKYCIPASTGQSAKQSHNRGLNSATLREKLLHEYDEVPRERVFLESARSSVALDLDDASIWSLGSFDGDDEFSSPEPSRQGSPVLNSSPSKLAALKILTRRSPLRRKLQQHNDGTTLLLPTNREAVRLLGSVKYMEMSPQLDRRSDVLRQEARITSSQSASRLGCDSPQYDTPVTRMKQLRQPSINSLPTDKLGYAHLDV